MFEIIDKEEAGGTVIKPNNCYYKGTGSVVQGVVDTGDTKNLCLNCHRADVYGLVNTTGDTNGRSCDSTNQTTLVTPARRKSISVMILAS